MRENGQLVCDIYGIVRATCSSGLACDVDAAGIPQLATPDTGGGIRVSMKPGPSLARYPPSRRARDMSRISALIGSTESAMRFTFACVVGRCFGRDGFLLVRRRAFDDLDVIEMRRGWPSAIRNDKALVISSVRTTHYLENQRGYLVRRSIPCV